MTRKSAKTTASSPPIRTAEGDTEPVRLDRSAARLLLIQQWHLGWDGGGGFERKLDLPRGKMIKKGLDNLGKGLLVLWVKKAKQCVFFIAMNPNYMGG